MRIYSNAFNFASFLSGGVDVRTGQYGCRIQLATIAPEGPADASRDIALSFSMMEERNTGYGLGWTLTQSEYDENTRRLRLISGDVYTSDPLPSVGSRLNLRDQKLQNLAVRRTDANTLHVIHSDGVIEVLTRRRSGPLFVLTQLIFENGERFNLSYTTDDLLESVTNPARTPAIITMRYNNQQLQSVAVLQERGRVAHTHLSIFNQQLTSISLPSESASSQNLPGYTFAYQDVNGWLAIRSLQNPLGGSDELMYTANGHQFFSGQFIPFVSQLTSRGGAAGTADITHRYTYSPNSNFTGFPFGGSSVDPAFDNIYVHTSEYNYSCTDQVLDASGSTLLQTQTTFNRFHLQTLEQTTRGTNVIEVRHFYNETANLAFAQQPANLQLIRQTQTTYRVGGASRQETEHIVTDNFGNERSRTSASGVRHDFEYYPVAGTPGRCPAEPHGLFERFVSREIIHAASGGGGTKTTDYTYTSIAGLAGGVPYVLLQSSVFAGLTNQSTYQQSTTAALHGKLTRSQVILNNVPTSRVDFTYSLDSDVLTENRNAVGADNTSLSLSQSTSVVNHLLLSTQKNNVLTIVFSYDINGRVTSETVSPGLPNQAVRQYAYIAAGGGNLARTEMTDALGGIYVTRYNGFARPVSVHQRISGNEQLLQENTYNRLGQVVTQMTVDRFGSEERRYTTQYAYDNWGHVNRVTYPDNRIGINDDDPIGRTRRTGLQGHAFVRTNANAFGKFSSIDQLANNNQAVQAATYTYDGFGRCVSQTDVHGSTTSFSYDVFDRIIRESFAPAGGAAPRTIDNTYSPRLVELAKTSVRVNQIELARATYDDVGRHKETYRGRSSAATVISYNNNSTRPSSIRSPSNITKSFQYNMQLEATTLVSVPNQSNTFSFHARTGGLASAVNTEVTRSISEDQYGRIAQDTSRIQNSDYRNTFTYSQAGRLTSFTSALGDTETITYDNAGRVSRASIGGANGATDVTLTYDNVGRVQSINTAAANGSTLYTLSYDIFGRESSRRIMQNQSLLMTINLTYHRDNRLATRQITNTSGAMISAETFAYDAYGRLTNFTAAGPQYPIDRHGRSVRAQQFSYDVLDNLTNVVTSFVGQADDVSQRTYNGTDPTQPTQISHSNPAQTIALSYDTSGRLIRAGDDVYSYDGFDKLVSVTTANGNPLSSYGYDATGRQALQFDASSNAVSFHYAGERLTGVRQASTNARFVRYQDTVLARSISGIGTELYASDNAQNVRSAVAPTGLASHVQYMPYGVSAIDSNSNGSLLERHRPGFNGERLDPLARLYHLGNGQRAYDPDLMTFLTPDPTSPFGRGLMNAYGYCGGDPINFSDPSGLSRSPSAWHWALFGVGLLVTVGFLAPALKGFAAAALAKRLVMGAKAVVSLTGVALYGASLSIAEVDAAHGTDRSETTNALLIAATVFGVLAIGASLTRAVGSLRIRSYSLNRSNSNGRSAAWQETATELTSLNRVYQPTTEVVRNSPRVSLRQASGALAGAGQSVLVNSLYFTAFASLAQGRTVLQTPIHPELPPIDMPIETPPIDPPPIDPPDLPPEEPPEIEDDTPGFPPPNQPEFDRHNPVDGSINGLIDAVHYAEEEFSMRAMEIRRAGIHGL